MNTHPCDTCGARHAPPKAWRAIRAIVLAVAFSVIEVLAALRLDGPLSWGLWSIAIWNSVLLAMLIVGLALTAAAYHDKATDA